MSAYLDASPEQGKDFASREQMCANEEISLTLVRQPHVGVFIRPSCLHAIFKPNNDLFHPIDEYVLSLAVSQALHRPIHTVLTASANTNR